MIHLVYINPIKCQSELSGTVGGVGRNRPYCGKKRCDTPSPRAAGCVIFGGWKRRRRRLGMIGARVPLGLIRVSAAIGSAAVLWWASLRAGNGRRRRFFPDRQTDVDRGAKRTGVDALSPGWYSVPYSMKCMKHIILIVGWVGCLAVVDSMMDSAMGWWAA